MKKPIHKEKEFTILGGYKVRWDSTTGEQGALVRKQIDLNKTGDTGADPVGDGTFKMHPSGDIVDYAERQKRLGK